MRELAFTSLISGGPKPTSYGPSQLGGSVAVDALAGSRFALRGGALTCYDAEGAQVWETQLDALLQGQEGSPDAAGSWLSAYFLSRPGCVFVCHSGGTLATVEVASGGTVVDLVGELEGGVLATAWTPDEALVAIATGSGSIVVMTAQWDVIAEAPVEGLGAAKGEPVSLAWRSDGQHLVVSFCPCPALGGPAGPRCLRIFTQDLSQAVMGRNEDGSGVSGLHAGAVAWSPDGELIACGMSVLARSRLQVGKSGNIV